MTDEKDSQDTELVDQAENYVSKLLKNELNDKALYHGINHTADVVEASEKLAKKRELDKENMELLLLAAWFHDTGYTQSHEEHEEYSQKIAQHFLEERNFSKNKTEKVLSLIASTKKDVSPDNPLEEILHDADLAHMGRKRFFRRAELLRVELDKVHDKRYTDLQWEKNQYEFLVNHTFITPEASEEYGKRRVKNLKKQRSNIVKARKITTRQKTGKDFGRGIDTLYRSSYRAHINFSAIADGKANMMISINTILISVIVTLSGASLSVNQGFSIERFRYTIPILVLLVGALASVLFAVLSARPKVTEKKVDMEEVKNNKISLLYFGNFLGIPKNDFIDYLTQLKADQKKLYDSMSIDIYNLGIVLKEKYRLLSISYNIFMTGLTISVVAFVVIFIYTNNN